MATNGNLSHHDQYKVSADQYAAPASTTDNASASSSTNNLPKDEVGWYFVEQYYTTLSKSPEKLHLFYGKKSQFVYGLETQVSEVSVGRQAIQERIKALDFQESKVRISNVDSQGSGECIVIQVIGEISNNAGEPKKFVQTFVLAQQPSGYFVLNDMLRYIKEEDEEEATKENAAEEAPATEAATVAPSDAAPAEESSKAEEKAEDVKPVAEIDPVVVDQKLEDVNSTAEAPSDSAAPASAEPSVEAQDASGKAEAAPETVTDPEKVAEEIAEEEVKKTEVPKDPSPTPAAPVRTPAPAPPAAEPEKPKEPPKPMTWASRLAAAAGAPPRPAVALPKPAAPAVPQPRPQAAAPAAAPQSAAPASTAASKATEITAAPASGKDSGSEWETAQTKRPNRPQSISASPADKESPAAYIKNVTEKIGSEQLRTALAKYGELAYFDINRQKNCAFVEFATQAGYNAAVAANPHNIDGEPIFVEQRRPKATAYGGSSYGSSRGGMAGRGRGGYDGGRGGNQGSVRGTYQGQTRGGRGGATRGGRGAGQAGNA